MIIADKAAGARTPSVARAERDGKNTDLSEKEEDAERLIGTGHAPATDHEDHIPGLPCDSIPEYTNNRHISRRQLSRYCHLAG